MDNTNEQIVPERFIEARVEQGLTQMKLSEISGISRPTISNLEKGLLLSPRLETVSSIAWVLHKPKEFFYVPVQREFIPTTVLSFRSLKGKTKMHNDQAEIIIKRYIEFLTILYNYIEPRFSDISTEKYCDKDLLYLSNSEIEAYAARIRDYWNLGDDPIINLCTILENHGIFCHQNILPSDIDSINRTFRPQKKEKEISIIVVNSNSSYFRQRFNLAHELGHIILHHNLTDDEYIKHINIYEYQANRFAAAFLMPSEEFSKHIFDISLNGIRVLKDKWKVSMSAIIYRMAELYIISEAQKQTLFINLSKRGWKKKEPLDDLYEAESPYYLKCAYDFLLHSKKITANEIIEYTGLFKEEIVEYIGNKEFFFNNSPNLQYLLKRK